MSRAIPLFRKLHIGATLKTRNKHQLEKWRGPGNYCQRKPKSVSGRKDTEKNQMLTVGLTHGSQKTERALQQENIQCFLHE